MLLIKFVIFRATIITIVFGMSNCVSLIAKKNTYLGNGPSVKINGADVRIQVSPQGTANGSVALSAMVVSTAIATMEGPFLWRVEAEGKTNEHRSLVIHRIKTMTEKTKKSEWYPAGKLGKRADFRKIMGFSEQSKARYEIPGLLQVMSANDGKLTILVDMTVYGFKKSERKLVKFQLDPGQKKQNEVIFLPTEIVKNIGKNFEDMEDSSWD
jgi:hypothetical protein